MIFLRRCSVRLRGLLTFSVEDVHNEASKALYVWRIADFWSEVRRAFLSRRQLFSVVFETPYGHEFRLRACPRRGQGFAVYLEVPSTSQLPAGWHRKVMYTLTLHNQIGREDAVRCGQAIFTASCAAWGYHQFVSATKEWVLDDAVYISAHVRVLDPVPSFHAMTLALGLVGQRERAVRDASASMMRDMRRAGRWLVCECGAQLEVAGTVVRCPASCAADDLATIHARLRDAMAQSCAGGPPFDDLAWPKPLVAFTPEMFQRAVIVNDYVDLRLREARSRRRYEWHRFFDRCVASL